MSKYLNDLMNAQTPEEMKRVGLASMRGDYQPEFEIAALEAQLAEADRAFSVLLGDPYMQEGVTERDKLEALMRGCRGKCNPADAQRLLAWRETVGKLAEARAVLKLVEWVRVEDVLHSAGDEAEIWRWCPGCDTWKRTDEPDEQQRSHAPDCRLARALNE